MCFPAEVTVQPVQEPYPDKNSQMRFPDFGIHDNQTFQTISNVSQRRTTRPEHSFTGLASHQTPKKSLMSVLQTQRALFKLIKMNKFNLICYLLETSMETDTFTLIQYTEFIYSKFPVFPLTAHSVPNHNLVAFVMSLLTFNY